MTSTVEKKDRPIEDELVVANKASKVGEASAGGVVLVADSSDVRFSTVSTTEPGPQNNESTHSQVDGSVISAITDHASLTETPMHHPSSDHAAPTISSLPDVAVPTQVILSGSCSEEAQPDEACDPSDHSSPTVVASAPAAPTAPPSPPPEPSEPTLVVTEVIPDSQSVNSTSALPDPRPALVAEPDRSHPRSVSGDPMIRSPPPRFFSKESDDALDDYMSPEAQNAIVERSPGGRYVRFTEKLGSGASKDVYRAYDTQEGIEVAWNVVTLSGVPKNERNRIVNEVRLLERLHHQNIISFHGSWVNRERQEVNFVTEILSSGTLKSFIAKVQVIRWKIAKRWARQILLGLEYLHSQDPPVIHRDLKCENVFINGTSGDLRIGDLGLSTVHRNGRVLSVLGTPEFMAPDMYEDRSYDEKVDIYAFGMCMLEIFTKEIPYSECNNPAQIYKKVSSGEPPEVLSRLKSRHAREFVELCLGFKDETGMYVRPSATELLKHPFLVERSDDGGEVVVERPLRERAIMEDRESNGSSLMQYRTNPSNSRARVTSYDDENDQFDAMPESETNMKKIKVLMGRDQVLDEEVSAPAPLLSAAKPEHAHTHFEVSQVQEPLHPPPPPQQADQQLEPLRKPEASKRHYLVAAAVIEDKGPNIRPYADDILQLVVTLPVEGQTQNVQFGFHLVEDDAVQVAREMVQELDIPQDAVLEVSETISALACEARKKQEKYSTRMRQQQVTGQPQIHGTPSDHHGTLAERCVQTPGAQSYAPPQDQPLQQGQPPSTYAPASYATTVAETSQNSAHLQTGHVAQVTHQQPSEVHHGQGHVVASAHHPPLQHAHHSQPHPTPNLSQQHLAQGPMGATPSYHGAPAQTPVSQHPPLQQAPPVQMQVAPETIPQQHQVLPDQHLAPQVAQTGNAPAPTPQYLSPEHQQVLGQTHAAPVQREVHANYHGVPLQGGQGLPPSRSGSHAALHALGMQEAPALQKESPPPPHAENMSYPMPAPPPPHTENMSYSMPPPPQPYAENMSYSMPPPPQPHAENMSYSMPAPPQPHAENMSYSMPAPPQPHAENMPYSAQASPEPSSLGLPPGAPLTVESVMQAHAEAVSRVMDEEGLSPSLHHHLYTDEDDLNDEVKEKLRKLEEDYQKNLKIAKKVFEGRMENLARSQTEKEAQHQKTLEKHEKERLAFEKRRALEEEQQMKRIEQLQKEWDKKREMLAQQALAAAGAQSDTQQQSQAPALSEGGPTPFNGVQDQLSEQLQVPPGDPPQVAQRNVSTGSTAALQPPSGEGTDQSQHVQ